MLRERTRMFGQFRELTNYIGDDAEDVNNFRNEINQTTTAIRSILSFFWSRMPPGNSRGSFERRTLASSASPSRSAAGWRATSPLDGPSSWR